MTTLLGAWSDGDREAQGRLLPVIYDELHRMAEACFRRQSPAHTLQPTALVHEAFMRLERHRDVRWRDRAHFFAVAAMAMRQILVNHAKGRRRHKRGGDCRRIVLDDGVVSLDGRSNLDLVALDEALRELSTFDVRKARVVELRFFAGLSIQEAAEALRISVATVKREWSLARAWLLRELRAGAAP